MTGCTFADENGSRCGAPLLARGLCKPHYDQARRAGTLPVRAGDAPIAPSCAVIEDGEPCGRPHMARGLCSMHYERWRTHGSVRPRRAIGLERRVLDAVRVQVPAPGVYEVLSTRAVAGHVYGCAPEDVNADQRNRVGSVLRVLARRGEILYEGGNGANARARIALPESASADG